MAACGSLPLAASSALSQRPASHAAALRQAAPSPPAQAPHGTESVLDATGLGSPLSLNKGWKVGITTDIAAERPGFDDSGWSTRDASAEIREVEENPPDASQSGKRNGAGPHRPPNDREYAWFRLHVKLKPGHGPIALYIEVPVPHSASTGLGAPGVSVEVYANGRHIQPEGPNTENPQRYQQISRIYDLGLAPADTTLTLVLRTPYRPFGYAAYTTFFSDRKLLLGDKGDLENTLTLWSTQSFFERLPRLVDSILLLVLGIFLLTLYSAQKGHPEYLWLAIYELLQAPIGFIDLAGSSARLDSLWYAAAVLQLLVASAYLYFEFLIAFLGLRKRWYIVVLRYGSPVLAAVGPTLLMVGHNRAVGFALAFVIVYGGLWIVGWFLFIFITLIAATLRRNFEAGLLLLQLVLSMIGVIEPLITALMSDWSGHPVRSPLTIQAGYVPIHFSSIADFTGIVVIVVIIFARFLRIHRDQERASSELAAARSVQELMIPLEKIATPGFEVDSIYDPANEVGGDFFHVQPYADGSLLVVIGDVAGKGLKAAMNVSMLMGALRRTTELSPAKVLESLNRVLSGNESFTTCQAVWFAANGEVVLANAGHLPPYLNSQELMLPGGLPLGVLPHVTYDEVRLYLHPGDRLLLLSDGVVEARSASGELFGFDRVHNLSNQSAFYVAEAAKAFGQDDDITVLTVRRLAEVLAA